MVARDEDVIRNEVLEEAAKMCEGKYEESKQYHAITPAVLLDAASRIRALKREPNAAAQYEVGEIAGQPGESLTAPAAPAGPAHELPCWPVDGPAAPDVAEVLSDWRVVAEFFASRNWPDTKLGDAASRLQSRLPALLAKLGQGWVPVSADNPTRQVAWIDNDARHVGIFVCSNRYLLTLPPVPGASDE